MTLMSGVRVSTVHTAGLGDTAMPPVSMTTVGSTVTALVMAMAVMMIVLRITSGATVTAPDVAGNG